METLFSWVHLADLHLRFGPTDSSDPALVRERLLEDVSRLAQSAVKPEAILVTGDLAFTGRGYADVEAWLGRLSSSLGLGAEDIYIVPGNHDVDREADRDRSVARLVQSLREGQDALDNALADEGDRGLLTRRFQPYLDFTRRSLYWTSTREGRGRPIRLVGLNTTLIATCQGDRGKLRVGIDQMEDLNAHDGALVVALMHHPAFGGWLADEKNVSVVLRNHAHLVLITHAHAGGSLVEGVQELGAGASRRDGHVTFNYNVGTILADQHGSLTLRSWPRRWMSTIRDFRTDVEMVPDGQAFLERALFDPGYNIPSTSLMVVRETTNSYGSPRKPTPMASGYINKISIDNIRVIRSLRWSINARPGWYVIIGDNASGKSSALKGIAAVLLGTSPEAENLNGPWDSAVALRLNLKSWIRLDTDSARIALEGTLTNSTDHPDEISRELIIGASSSESGGLGRWSSLFSAGFGPFRRFTGATPSTSVSSPPCRGSHAIYPCSMSASP